VVHVHDPASLFIFSLMCSSAHAGGRTHARKMNDVRVLNVAVCELVDVGRQMLHQ